MRCFLGCFGVQKNRRHQNGTESHHSLVDKLSVESPQLDDLNSRVHRLEEVPETTLIPVTNICDKAKEICENSPSPNRKRVTFDPKVKTYEHIALQESVELLDEKKAEIKKPEEKSNSSENSDVTSNSSGSYPSNHRYQNCRESDDEEEDELNCSESDLDDDDDDEEYYSDDGSYEDELLIDNLGKEVYTEEIADNCLEIEGKTRGTNENVHGVLNPVENLTQWKAAKDRTIQKQPQKENSNFISNQEDIKGYSSIGTELKILKENSNLMSNQKDKRVYSSIGTEVSTNDQSFNSKNLRNQDLAIDASLSTWLSTSETTSECNSFSMEKQTSSCNSKPVKSHEDRPILCALTLEEIKQISATSTPRKSPSRSSDDTPIIGTVGGYWNNHLNTLDCASASSFKGIPNTTSKYREDNKVKWHSTPFEARLEKALNKT